MNSPVVKERPMLFSGAMVRALLAGTKTQTRRAVKPQFPYAKTGRWTTVMSSTDASKCGNIEYGKLDPDGFHFTDRGRETILFSGKCPYGQPGDRLWVRETWAQVTRTELFGAGQHQEFVYRAGRLVSDGKGKEWVGDGFDRLGPSDKWKPSIHMPRTACRILLEVVSVRVERLRDISEADARAEGYSGFMDFYDLLSNADKMLCDLMNEDVDDYARRKGINYPIEWYHMLWDKINGTNAWFANPWVWVVEFKRIDSDGKEVARA